MRVVPCRARVGLRFVERGFAGYAFVGRGFAGTGAGASGTTTSGSTSSTFTAPVGWCPFPLLVPLLFPLLSRCWYTVGDLTGVPVVVGSVVPAAVRSVGPGAVGHLSHGHDVPSRVPVARVSSSSPLPRVGRAPGRRRHRPQPSCAAPGCRSDASWCSSGTTTASAACPAGRVVLPDRGVSTAHRGVVGAGLVRRDLVGGVQGGDHVLFGMGRPVGGLGPVRRVAGVLHSVSSGIHHVPITSSRCESRSWVGRPRK